MHPPAPNPPPAAAAAATPPPLLQENTGGVLRLTLNRPAQFNALSEDLLAALRAALDAAADDPAVRVIIVAAAGKAFCAGHDLRQIQENPRLDYYQWLFAECARIMRRMRTLPQPVIARVQGLATAGGCQLVASCDLAVASQAARFAASGIHIGLFCATPAVPLSRNMGQKQAFEMLFTGDFIDAATARERGLVNRVVAADALDAEVDALAGAILDKPASIVAAGKALFYRQQEMGSDAAYQLAVQAMAANVMDPQAREGISAFLEKRPPGWRPER
jgi:enoyl-CoA hydratase/carnithine racemase